MQGIKTVSYKEVEDHIRMPYEFWERVSGLTSNEKKSAIRQELELSWNNKFLSAMKGKTLEKQMEYYRIEEYSIYNGNKSTSTSYALKDYEGLKALIVEDDVIIGVCIDASACYDALGRVAFPYHDICTYYASDNNGSGYKDREDYAHLCLVAPE